MAFPNLSLISDEQRLEGDVMASERTDQGPSNPKQDVVPSGGASRGRGAADFGQSLEMMSGLWTSWMERYFGATQNWIEADKPWWKVTPDEITGSMLAGGMKQVNDLLAKDPLLGYVDQMWNANPMRTVVPIDWAEITRALRTVWLLSLRKPKDAAELEPRPDHVARPYDHRCMERGGPAASWAKPTATNPKNRLPPQSDKRFAAPDWQGNPIYRTMKELYLLASDWLLKQGEIEGLDEAERLRLNFHLRQFVDAMSPTLLLLSNPDAVRRAFETGGASVADGARNLLSDLKEGRLSIVDLTAFAPGVISH